MYAIIRSGGKQTKVAVGDVIEVERLKDPGDTAELTPLLIVADDGSTLSGRDELSGAIVTAKVLGEHRGDKIDIFKYKNKTGYRRRAGHRQTYTSLEITGIDVPKKKAPAKKAPAKKAPAKKAEAKKTEKNADEAPADESSDNAGDESGDKEN